MRNITCLFLFLMFTAGFAGAVDYIWIEADDNPEADFKWKTEGATWPDTLTNKTWLMIEDRPKEAPKEGWSISYTIDVENKGEYNLWLRIGYERLRPGVHWRIDGGEWDSVGVVSLPPHPDPKKAAKEYKSPHKFNRYSWTTNVKEIGFWANVAWWDLGKTQLSKGKHKVEFKFLASRIKNPLLALDAICLVKGKWTPEGKLKPGETYSSEEDQKAASHVFELPEPSADNSRTEVDLAGPWQIARYDDPDMDKDTYEPVKKVPSKDEYNLKWMAASVPDKKLNANPELKFAHRVIYRTKVNVPIGHKGRGFKLHFEGTHWIASVIINGKYAGFRKSVWIPWDLDVTDFIEPGKINEIVIGIKGHYYAFDPQYWDKTRGGLDENRHRPQKYTKNIKQIASLAPSTKGDGNGYIHGVVNPVYLISTGRAYVEDVFIKPSVQNNKLETEVTVLNKTGKDGTFQVSCEAIYDPDTSNSPEKKFGPVDITVPAGKTAMTVVAGAWDNPKLWWPKPKPHLYRLRTKVTQNGNLIDMKEELFGFREMTIKGTGIYINGIRRNLWNWVGPSKNTKGDSWVERWRNEDNRFVRFTYGLVGATKTRSREEYLEVFDREGVPGRLCSMVDGMFNSHYLGDRLQDKDEEGDRIMVPNKLFWENACEHIAQMVKAYRNHPSVIMYQIENELIYVNGNHYSSYYGYVEAEEMKMYLAGYEFDKTKPYTVGGGGDLRFAKGFKGRRLEINCPHYPRASEDYYPDDAYHVSQYSTKIKRWPWDRTNPWFPGESLYAAEINMGSYAAGPIAYRNTSETNKAKAKLVRAIYEGYRWGDVAAFAPWCNLSMYEDGKEVFSPLTAIPRKRAYRLFAGRENKLHFKVMNDTFSKKPVTFEWEYNVGGKRVAGETKTLNIEPGFGEEQWLLINAPESSSRLEGELKVKVAIEGEPEFNDEFNIPVMPSIKVKMDVPVIVYDKKGNLSSFLTEAGVTFEKISDIKEINDKKGLLIIGNDTLTPDESFGSDILKFAVKGNQVVCLEQEFPLGGSNLSAPVRSTTRFGGYAHPQALGTPIFRDIQKDDLNDWAGDHPTYKNAFVKPSQGARSLVECGPLLPYSSLLEMGAGEGMIIACQLRIGAKLKEEPAAGVLLRNMIETYGGKKPSSQKAAVFAKGSSLLADKIASTGVLADTVKSLEGVFDIKEYKTVIIEADSSSMEKLISLREQAELFQKDGGWIMICGISPKTIDSFNEIAGTKHLLRPFRIERAFIQNPFHPLAATLGDSNVAYNSPQAIAAWKGLYWVSPNTFSWVIDGMDAGPFMIPPGAGDDPYEYKPVRNDRDPYNYVNTMFREDFWKYIRQIWVVKEGKTDPGGKAGPIGLDHTFKLRKTETIKQINIWNNGTYSTIKDLDIVFDGDESTKVSVVLPDAAELKEIVLPEPRTAGETISLKIRTWRIGNHGNPNTPYLVGIDNVQFIREKAPSYGTPLDNVGGLYVFPKGKGGIFLNQVKFMEDEPKKVNAHKKVVLTSVILQNMGLGSKASTVAVPGFNIRYETINLVQFCNVYLTKPAERGKPVFLREGLPTLTKGKNFFNDVEYHVVDYGTAPVPDAINVEYKKPSAQGIAIEGKKADVLFFMHTAHVTRPVTDAERAKMLDKRRPFSLPTVATYVIHYEDGKSADIPVILERHVDNWVKENPVPLADASVAWTAGLKIKDKEMKRVLYTMKVSNPRPDVPIKSIDVENGYRDAKGKWVRDRRVYMFGVTAITLGKLLTK